MSESTPGPLGGSGEAEGGQSYMSFPALSTPQHSTPGAVPLRPLMPTKSALKGHQRSASHGGVASRPAATGGVAANGGSANLVSRPSALKSPGHQRAFSQGQITEQPSELTRGHSRTGSRTEFILPAGHRDPALPASAASLFRPGHKRQASRTESIYTLRQGKQPSVINTVINYILRRPLQDEVGMRTVVPSHLVVNVPRTVNPNARFCSNFVSTTKYTLLTFLPLNLYHQFQRMANIYFSFIVLLNWFPVINAFGKEISIIPVAFVIGVTAVKDLFEDRRRHISDKRVNNSTCRVYSGQEKRYRKVQWKEVRVGDIVHLSNNEQIPADVLLLRSSDPHGICYVDSCNLDGETNLKARVVAPGLLDKQSLFDPSKFDSLIEVDPPTTKIYRFHGSLVHPSGERVPLGSDNLLLRECMVKNTDFIEGIVVYAGHETKALLNNDGTRNKRSSIERQMNRDIIWCVVILLVLCLIGAVGCRMWLSSYLPPVPFIPFPADPDYEGFLTFFTFVIILQVMIPLSLYVSVEMTKLLQVFHIHQDPGLYDADLKKGAECRALNTTEELGQVQYLFSDKTGTLTENKMAFRRCSIAGVDYNHPPPPHEQRLKTRPGAPLPLLLNSKLQQDLSAVQRARPSRDDGAEAAAKFRQAQRLQEFFLLLALCNTVVVSKHPHRDAMNASGLIENVGALASPLAFNKTTSLKNSPSTNDSQPVSTNHVVVPMNSTNDVRAPIPRVAPLAPPESTQTPPPTARRSPLLVKAAKSRLLMKKLSSPVINSTEKVLIVGRSNSDLCLLPLRADSEAYARLCESRSVTPSPPPPISLNHFRPVAAPLATSSPHNSLSSLPPQQLTTPQTPHSSPTLAIVTPSGSPQKPKSAPHARPRLLNVPSLLFVGKKAKNKNINQASTPSPCELKPIFEAESPDELALVDAAHSYDCRLLKRTPTCATIVVPGDGVLDFEILKVLPFDAARKMMSVVVRHPVTKQIILYCKGADSAILCNLAATDNIEAEQHVFRTQQHVNSYSRQGLRTLLMAKRPLTEAEYLRWLAVHKEAELANEGREALISDSYARLERAFTLLGATGIEDRLQDGVPECISALRAAGIVVWVLTGDKPETAINVAYSAKLFAPHMEIIHITGRSKTSVENAIKFHLTDIQTRSPRNDNVRIDGTGVFGRGIVTAPTGPERFSNKRALVIDGKTLTFILAPRLEEMQRPFLELTQLCSSVLCCRATPLQKSMIVKIVKEILHKRTLAVGDGANDVSMIQMADVGIGISGQEGMQAIMAADYALARFRFLERFLLVHGHWCYDRLARMVLYFFYKNATFVFLIFWYQLYCGYSGQVMIDQMYLMLYNLLFTSMPPLAIGVYDQDAPEELLLGNPSLYRQGRLGTIYQPASFWIVMADSVYQSIVIFFITLGAFDNTDIGLWAFGTTITTACMFIMLTQVAIETKSWTLIHVAAIAGSIGIYFAFALIYNGLCDECFGLPSNYQVMQTMISTPVFWLVQLLTTVLALLPRWLWIIYTRWLNPRDVERAVKERKSRAARGEAFLATWSRSTSTSSIYRNIDVGLKNPVAPNMATVG